MATIATFSEYEKLVSEFQKHYWNEISGMRQIAEAVKLHQEALDSMNLQLPRHVFPAISAGNSIGKLADVITRSVEPIRHACELNVECQRMLNRLDFNSIGRSLQLAESVRNRLVSNFDDFSNSYASLYDSISENGIEGLSGQSVLAELPAVEYFNEVKILARSAEGEEFAEGEKFGQTACDDLSSETSDSLTQLIVESDAELANLLVGSRQALDSSNPDRIRHFSVSLRELFTQVIHRLAPEDQLIKWSTSKDDFAHGKPTRRARLKFISRHVSVLYGDFVRFDVNCALEFLSEFHKGTHQPSSNFTDGDLISLQRRMEGLIRFLLEMSGLKD